MVTTVFFATDTLEIVIQYVITQNRVTSQSCMLCRPRINQTYRTDRAEFWQLNNLKDFFINIDQVCGSFNMIKFAMEYEHD